MVRKLTKSSTEGKRIPYSLSMVLIIVNDYLGYVSGMEKESESPCLSGIKQCTLPIFQWGRLADKNRL